MITVLATPSQILGPFFFSWILCLLSFYTFLSIFMLARTNHLILVLHVWPFVKRSPNLKPSIESQFLSDTTAGVHFQHLYFIMSLFHHAPFHQLLLFSCSQKHPMDVLRPTYALPRLFILLKPTSYWQINVYPPLTTDFCLKYWFIKYWTEVILFSSARVQSYKNLPSYSTCPSSHPPLKISSAVTP